MKSVGPEKHAPFCEQRRFAYGIFAFLLFLLAGCGSSSSSAPKPTPTPTVTSTPGGTATPTATATGSQTPAICTATPTPSPAPTATTSAINISPNVALNNPSSAASSTTPQTFSLTFTAYDSNGNQITPTNSNFMTVNIYGDFPSPNNVISPDSFPITSANTTVTLSYNGNYFPNNLEVEAYIKDPSVSGGYALGSAVIMHANQVPCASSTVTYPIDLLTTSPSASGLTVKAAVGYSSAPSLSNFTIDTGSLGTVVPKSLLGPNAIGPGASALVHYTSNGQNTFTGHMYLAPVSIQAQGVVVQTNPIQVLVLDPNQSPLNYLGVGFDRNDPVQGDLFHTPAMNAFLNVTNANNGTDVAEGYILTSTKTAGANLGISSEAIGNFTTVNLAQSNIQFGDWLTPPGCFSFPQLPGVAPICGTVLLDVGIGDMYLGAPSDQWPPAAVDATLCPPSVPANTQVEISVGNNLGSPAMNYSFSYTPPNTAPPGPTAIHWSENDMIGVNTGRNPLTAFNYMYDSQCGMTGYAPVQSPGLSQFGLK
ncbi:MAG TPA: hypothetical protein VMH37_13675 [Candidatus Binataceae bacterium]|nr:hypothetical protein [Candidatus Binataceae bacterium]